MAWTERGCCISPSSLAGGNASLPRIAEIEEMSLEDEDDDLDEEIKAKFNDDDSTVEDVGDLVLVEDAETDIVEREEKARLLKLHATNEEIAENENFHAEIIATSSEQVEIETKQEKEDEIDATKSLEQAISATDL